MEVKLIYKLLDKQKEFIEIPHNNALDVAIYQGGFGSGKTWCGSLLGILLAMKYPECKGLVGAKEYELVRKTTLCKDTDSLFVGGFIATEGHVKPHNLRHALADALNVAFS